jgi:molecular chaperone DnaK (HSP70)
MVTACITAASVFAAPDVSNTINAGREGRPEVMSTRKCEDPVKALQKKKENIEFLVKEGRMTKDEANPIIKRIDDRLKAIQEFNSLTLEQKKEMLISNFKAAMARKVENGRLTKEKSDELIKSYTEKVQKWDGSGYPGFCGKGMRQKGNHDSGNK